MPDNQYTQEPEIPGKNWVKSPNNVDGSDCKLISISQKDKITSHKGLVEPNSHLLAK